ncbi:MAG: four helix bundle protein [Candidatus Yanofskybacteria bacterium]|nr:four helix bundle protein [Candidatus Yanofskybacteria bacterium]
MSNIQTNSNFKSNKFDLEDRTARFGELVIDLCKLIKQDLMTKNIISQLLRSRTSIGANYCEASEANSKKDFINKIAIAKKETKETRYWLRMLVYTLPEIKDKASSLLNESKELNLIFAATIRTASERLIIK